MGQGNIWPSTSFPLRFLLYGSWRPFGTMFMIDRRALYSAIWLYWVGIEFEIKWPRRYR